MDFLISYLNLFWFLRTLKFILFWIYLWQLKEYHIGRFIDHFRTQKGNKLLFGVLPITKLVLLILLFSNYFFLVFFYALLLIYIAEAALFFIHFSTRSLKIPKFTFKTVLLAGVSIGLAALYLSVNYYYVQTTYWIVINLLIFDIATPLIVSAVVLVFQPLFVMGRNNILRAAALKIRTFDNLLVVAITGSYGKTSTKEFLTTILSEKFKVLSTKDHQNSEMGIAQTILKELNNRHEIFVVEMGAYKKGGIKLLCDMVKPTIGIVTGVNEQHLALFGSLENLLSAEGGEELAESLPENGLIILNGDNKYCLDLYKKVDIAKKIYALQRDKIDLDIWTEDIKASQDSLSFIVRTKQKEMAHFFVNVPGKQNAQNLLATILVARQLGVGMEEILHACKKITQAQAGITLTQGIHGINVIDSSYSSNPDGVLADLNYLNIFKGKKVVVMPCLIELGQKSAEIHQQIGKKIAQVCDMAIITTKDQFEIIKTAAIKYGMSQENITLLENSREIITVITTFCTKGDAVLLEGRVPGELIRLLHGK
jgi:UDP-N-acetylmuramoyl-tripeptide--D-alanyl-D-alanine ligase